MNSSAFIRPPQLDYHLRVSLSLGAKLKRIFMVSSHRGGGHKRTILIAASILVAAAVGCVGREAYSGYRSGDLRCNCGGREDCAQDRQSVGKVIEMEKGLDETLLLRIMHRISELSDRPSYLPSTTDLLDLVPQLDEDEARFFLTRHLNFLAELGYLRLNESYLDALISITATGQMFVQPELAGFGNSNLVPDLVKNLEQQIGQLTYPEPEKSGLIFRLREAVAKQAPDIVVKVLFEIVGQMTRGH